MTLLISVFAASDAKCFLYLDAVLPYIAERKWGRDATITVPSATNTAMNRGVRPTVLTLILTTLLRYCQWTP